MAPGGRRASRFSIVDDSEILDAAEIRDQIWKIDLLAGVLCDPDSSLIWLAQRRLVYNRFTCDRCNVPCALINYEKGIDGKQWCCSKCRRGRSVREGSLFSHSHLSLKQIIFMAYCWAQDLPQNLIMHEASIVGMNTIVDWCNFFREECAKQLDRVPQELGGFDANGEPIIVEIDESKYFHHKYHRGKCKEDYWVFGAVERDSGKCVLREMPDRSSATLLTLIEQHILPGTHIVSDACQSFEILGDVRNGIYLHTTVAHQGNFVDPDDPEIHQQNIKNLWMRARKKIQRQFGTSIALFPSYLREFEYRSSVRPGNMFAHFLVTLAGNNQF